MKEAEGALCHRHVIRTRHAHLKTTWRPDCEPYAPEEILPPIMHACSPPSASNVSSSQLAGVRSPVRGIRVWDGECAARLCVREHSA